MGDKRRNRNKKIATGFCEDTNALFRALNPKFTFDHFVSGSSNHIALTAATAFANNPADTYNPLFICGGEGLGKTHLLNSIGHTIMANSSHLNVCYCPVYEFVQKIVNYLRLNEMQQFKNLFRSVDMLLIDDIQFMSGNTGIQKEFSLIFNELYEAHKQIVITSDKHPVEIPGLGKYLRSGVECGIVVEIQKPDLETKVDILKKKAEIGGILLPDDVINFLASSNCINIRELEGWLVKLNAHSRLHNTPITLELVKEVLFEIRR